MNEGDGTARVRVSLSPSSTQTVSVDWTTEDGTATAGEDYADDDGTLIFSPGDTDGEITVSIIDDDEEDSSETFTVVLSNATGDATIDDGTGDVSITDNDDGEGPERPGAPRNLAGRPGDHRVTLTWSAPESDGGSKITRYDYRFVAGSGRFPPVWTKVSGGGGTRQFTVKGLSNGIRYRFQVRAVNKAGAGPPATTEARPVDPDATPFPNIEGASIDEDGGRAELTVSLSPASSEEVSVEYATSNGTATAGVDYGSASGTLTFAAGDTLGTISVSIIDDGDDESDESFSVELSNATGGAEIGSGTAMVTIVDNDGTEEATPPTEPTGFSANSGDGKVTLTWLAPASDGGSEVTGCQVGAGHRRRRGDHRVSVPLYGKRKPVSEDLGDRAGGGRAKQFTVGRLTNGIRYRFQVRAVNEAGAGEPEETKATPLPTMRGESGRGQEGRGQEVRFTVRLSAASNETVRVEFATADGTAIAGEEYRARSGRLTFAPGATLETIAVPLLDDGKHEQDETFRLELFNPANASFGVGLERLVLTGRIADDDELLSVAFAAGSYSVDEGGSVSVSVELSGGANEAIRIPVTADPGPRCRGQ